jgi:RNA methyltransferase, TrmH family
MITSLQNPHVKDAVRLRNARHRLEQGRIIIDGARELTRAVQAGLRMIDIFVCESLFAGEILKGTGSVCAQHPSGPSRQTEPVPISFETCGADILPVSEAVFHKIAFGSRTEGILGVAEMPRQTLNDISLPSPQTPLPKGEGIIIKEALKKNPLVAVLEGVEKPGNIGAVLRSVDAAGVSALIVCDGRTDLYNPNAIRASLGTIFTVPVCEATSGETIAWLRQNKISIVAARVDGSVPYTKIDYCQPTAIVLGSEAEGLTSAWTAADITAIRLPMLGAADSLNVSATAAVIFYEALRQRSI